MELSLLAKVTKKLKTLTLEYDEKKLVLPIADEMINLIELDMWLTELFKAEFEKTQAEKPKIVTLPKPKIIT